MGPENTPPPALAAIHADFASRQPPVTNAVGSEDDQRRNLSPALTERLLHVRELCDQPKEVLDAAQRVFCDAYQQQSVTGTKARALVLVALLWASRCLHGNNPSNEQYLLIGVRAENRTNISPYAARDAAQDTHQTHEQGVWHVGRGGQAIGSIPNG